MVEIWRLTLVSRLYMSRSSCKYLYQQLKGGTQLPNASTVAFNLASFLGKFLDSSLILRPSTY